MLELLPTIKAAISQTTLQACMEKWTEEKWGCALKRLVPYMSAINSFPLMDHLLDLTMLNGIPNAYILNCLVHAVAIQIISYRAAVTGIIRYNNISQPFHLTSLISFQDNILNFLTSSNEFDAAYCLLETLTWLLDILLKALNAILDNKLSGKEIFHQCIHSSCVLINKIVINEWRFALVNLAYQNYKDNSMASNQNQNVDEIKKEVLNFIYDNNHSFTAEFILPIKQSIDFKLGLSMYEKKVDMVMSSFNQPLNLSINSLISIEAMLNPCDDVASLLTKVLSIEAILNLSRSNVLLDLMRSCLLMVVDNVSKQDELKWASFTYLKLPSLINEMVQSVGKEVGQQEVVEAIEMLVEMNSLLDMADSKCNCDCLLYLVNELTNKYPIISEAQNKKIMINRQNNSMRSKLFDSISPAKETANLILRAEPTVTTILKSLDTSKNNELILGVMTQMMSGKSFELLLSAAAGTCKLQSFAAKLIKINEISKTALNTETIRFSQIRATLFDISFLMLCHIAQLYGLESIASNTECSNTFFQTWAIKFLPESEGTTTKPLVALNPPEQNKVELLLSQFSSNSELNTSLTRWNEICITTQYVVQELIFAWDVGAIDAESFKAALDQIKWNMCSLSIVAGAWLCNSIDTAPKQIREKMIIALQHLLNPCIPHETNIANYMERSHLARIILVQMTSCILNGCNEEKLYTMNILNQKLIKPPSILLSETLRTVAERGSCSSDEAYVFNKLLKIGGVNWFAKTSIMNLLNQSYGFSELNGVASILLSIFHIDIEAFTTVILSQILPTLLQTPTSNLYPSLTSTIVGSSSNLSQRGNVLMDPKGLVLAQLVVSCIYSWIIHSKNCTDHSKPRCRKRRCDFIYDINEDGERPPKTKCLQSNDLMFQISESSNYNENGENNYMSVENTESNIGEQNDILGRYIGNLFVLFYEVLVDNVICTQHYFVINFLKQIFKLDSKSIRSIFQYLSQNMLSAILRVLVKELSPSHILSIYKLDSKDGRDATICLIVHTIKLLSLQNLL